MDIKKAQDNLTRAGLDGWLMYGFQGNNPIATELLGLRGKFLSRRFFYFIPASGKPGKIVHAIERYNFSHLEGEELVYSSFAQLQLHLKKLVGQKNIAMEYWPGGGLPYLSRVDAGTLEMVRQNGAQVSTSSDLLLSFQTWSSQDFASHLRAVEGVQRARDAGLEYVRNHKEKNPTEVEVQQVISKALVDNGLEYDHAPNVSFGKNAGNPHHDPDQTRLTRGDVILFDIWAKEPNGPFADITWMSGWEVPQKVVEVFDIVASARDAGIALLQSSSRLFSGAEIDLEVRRVLTESGYEENILHRTGHSLGFLSAHADATHLDGTENPDHRMLIPGLGFTIEPGLYFETFGIRSEINMFCSENGAIATTDIQKSLEQI